MASSSKIARVRTLFGTQDGGSQTLNFVIGVGTVWVFLGVAISSEWIRAFPTESLPLLVGTALAYTALPAFITIGGHELAHEIVADEYCNYRTHDFGAFESTTRLTILSTLFAVAVLLITAFDVVSLPSWLVYLGVVSPGAVIAKGRSRIPKCIDEVAVVGPLYNLVIGLVLLYGGLVFPESGLLTGEFVPIVPAFLTLSVTAFQAVVSLTAFVSLLLAASNALPFGPLDGRKVWASGGLPMKVLLLVIILVPILILYPNLF